MWIVSCKGYLLKNNNKNGINSKRPIYISIIIIILEILCKLSKFPKGPMIFPNPGPILPRALTAPEIPITVFCSNIAITKPDRKRIAK